jgi:hypothetical protein
VFLAGEADRVRIGYAAPEIALLAFDSVDVPLSAAPVSVGFHADENGDNLPDLWVATSAALTVLDGTTFETLNSVAGDIRAVSPRFGASEDDVVYVDGTTLKLWSGASFATPVELNGAITTIERVGDLSGDGVDEHLLGVPSLANQQGGLFLLVSDGAGTVIGCPTTFGAAGDLLGSDLRPLRRPSVSAVRVAVGLPGFAPRGAVEVVSVELTGGVCSVTSLQHITLNQASSFGIRFGH